MSKIRETKKYGDWLLKSKPKGFHPIEKIKHKKRCEDAYLTLTELIERKKSGRIFNKSVSRGTRKTMEELRKQF